MKDYSGKVKDSPRWVQELYQAFQTTVDFCEWWVTFKQYPHGGIGGGGGDDVEIVGVFGYYGYVSRGLSDLCVKGTERLVNGVWTMSEIDPNLGYCLPLADAEHTAEWTGNTLGMMALIQYGNPIWVERCMKTAKLMRDLWTAYDDNGHRHFRSNFIGAAQVGTGDRRNDSSINYRAIRPAQTVLWYNQSPTIAKLDIELAEAWLAAAMSTDRGKPKGIIPAEIGFPTGIIGGLKSPTWYKSYDGPGTINEDWGLGSYKSYVTDLLRTAYKISGDTKFFEPARLEYEMSKKHGTCWQARTPARDCSATRNRWRLACGNTSPPKLRPAALT